MNALLERVRKISRLMQNAESVDYNSITRVLSEVLHANVYIANRRGQIYGHTFAYAEDCEVVMETLISKGVCSEAFAEWMLTIKETSANIQPEDKLCPLLDNKEPCKVIAKKTTFIPIYGVGERIGTLVMSRLEQEFKDDDLILGEFAATVVGMEMLRGHTKQLEVEASKKAAVQIAIATLSYSEVRAAIAIFSELEGTEGLLVASRIADNAGLTRSVIVNALRKFESAGVIESKSLGMKGTHIKVLNDHLLDEVRRLR